MRGIDPLFPNTGVRWKGMINFRFRTPYPRERSPKETEGWVDPRDSPDDSEKGKILLPLLGFKP